MTLRQRIPHFHDLTGNEYEMMRHSPFIDVTEKTDGMAFQFGYDDDGFFTRTSYSKKMREVGDYYKTAIAKFGDACKPEISQRFDQLHNIISFNEVIKDLSPTITGEIIFRSAGTDTGDGIRIVGTEYKKQYIGSVGLFIIHSQLSAFEIMDPQMLDNNELTWASDAIDDPRLVYDNLDSEERLRKYLFSMKPKWGNETEGYVLHMPYQTLPMVKVIDPAWKQRKIENGW